MLSDFIYAIAHMLYAGPSLETSNLLIIIHNSLGVSEYGSCITAQQLCVGH